MSVDKLSRNSATDTQCDRDYDRWVELESIIHTLGARAAAGNEKARRELVDVGPAVRLEMNRLSEKRRKRIQETTPPYDDIHTLTD